MTREREKKEKERKEEEEKSSARNAAIGSEKTNLCFAITK